MKIVHLIEYFSPALGYQETYLAREQQKLGHEVVVVTSDRYFPFPNYETTVKSSLGERIVGVGKRQEDGIMVIRKPIAFEIFTRAWIQNLVPTLKKLRPDVIHIHSVSSLSTLRVAFSRQFKDIVVLADDHSHLSVVAGSMIKDVFYGIYRTIFGRIVSQNIDHFVVITPETKKIVREYMGITSPIGIIELGADTNLFRPDPRGRKKIRKQLGLIDRQVVFIYTGKLIKEKGIDILIKAFLSVPDSYKLLIVGSGPTNYLDPLKLMLKQANKHMDVIWIPTVRPEELSKYYNAADVGIWPMQESISMLEASACGLAVIVKKSPSMALRVRNGNGLLYPEGNVKQLTMDMIWMGKHPSKRKTMGRRGRELISSQYSWKSIADQFILYYRKKHI